MRRYLNRSWVRLSLASSLFVLIAVLTVGVASMLLTQNDLFSTLLRDRLVSKGNLIDQLADSYRTYNGWNGLDSVMKNFSIPMQWPVGGVTLVVVDEGGEVLYDAREGTTGQRLSASERAESLTVTVDGRVRGYVQLVRLFEPISEAPENVQAFVFKQISRTLLIFAAVVGVFGVIAGTVLSRVLAAPLNELAETALAFGQKNFSKRATVRGSEEIIALAKAFNQMADALEQAEALRRNLVADVAHELRTPLTVLQANLQAIQDGVYPIDQTEMQKLIEQTELLSHLVSDLHELTQLEAKQLPLHQEILNVSALVSSTATKFEAVAARQQVSIHVQLPQLPDICIEGDINRIQQVINNLLQNALTHTPEGGSIALSLAQADGQAQIVVADSGNGVSAEHLPHIFERFYRVDRSRTRATGRAGLGLAIVKAIVEAHGGKISVTSEGTAGRGAAFTVMLPLAEVTASVSS